MGERESHDLPQDPEMESRLRWARPQPDQEFVSRLEGQLFVDARARHGAWRRSWRPAFAAGFAVAALALLTLVLDLAGLGPFGGSSNGPVEASDKCHTVVVTKRERVPLVQKKDGKDTVVFMYQDVQRHVKRCH